MAALDFSNSVAVLKVVFYCIALPVSLFVSFRHGTAKSSGWILLSIFSAIRIVNGASQLATISNDSETVAEMAIITGLLGLSPLLLATLGLLSRVYYSFLKKPWNTIFSLFLIRIFQTPAAVALILCIVGATSADSGSNIAEQPTVQAGVILLAVLIIALSFLAVIAIIGIRATQHGETSILTGVCLSLPLLLIRIIYSLLGCFGGAQFSPIEGSPAIDLGMSVIEEMLVVLIYLWVGLRNSAVPANDNEGAVRANRSDELRYRLGRGDFNGGKLSLLGLVPTVVAGVADVVKGRDRDHLEEHEVW